VAELDEVALVDRMFTLNLRTAFVVAREGLRHMGPSGGRVVLVGSASALHPSPGAAAYNAAKAGVPSHTPTLAAEISGSGRTANAVVPTVIDTPQNRAAMPDADHSRWPSPHDVARVIAWLATTESWVVNGALIPCPGNT
jgi:NAD(P)-dependent dehydrogenase (short-subunit alcohol dehydrogenase family)